MIDISYGPYRVGRILKRGFEMKKILEGGNNMRESILVTCGAHRQIKTVLKLLKKVSKTTY